MALVDKQSFMRLFDILITLEYLEFPNRNDPVSIFISPNLSASLIVYFLCFLNLVEYTKINLKSTSSSLM